MKKLKSMRNTDVLVSTYVIAIISGMKTGQSQCTPPRWFIPVPLGTDSKAQKRSPAGGLENELGAPKPPRGAVRLSSCSPPLGAGGGRLQVRGPQLHGKRSLLTCPVFSPATTHRCFRLWEGAARFLTRHLGAGAGASREELG